MSFDSNNYKLLNFKKNIRESSIAYVCNTKTKKNFVIHMQYHELSNFDCHKIDNSVVGKCLKSSTHANYRHLFSGLVSLAKPKNTKTMTKDLKKLSEGHLLLGLNVNNKIYTLNDKVTETMLGCFERDHKGVLKLFKISQKNLKKFRNNVT